MRFDVYEVAGDSPAPDYKPSRARAALADAALWQAAEYLAARIAAGSAQDVWAELRRFAAMEEIWGPGTDDWPNDSLLLAAGDGGALRVYAVVEERCRFCDRPHRMVPADLCPPARDEYDRVERWGDELGLVPRDPGAPSP